MTNAASARVSIMQATLSVAEVCEMLTMIGSDGDHIAIKGLPCPHCGADQDDWDQTTACDIENNNVGNWDPRDKLASETNVRWWAGQRRVEGTMIDYLIDRFTGYPPVGLKTVARR